MPRSVALRFKILRLVEPAWMVMGRMAGNTGALSFTSLKMMMNVDKRPSIARLQWLESTGCRPPLPLHVKLIWKRGNYPPPPHSDWREILPKPYQIQDMQRSCADVNSPYMNESAELRTQEALQLIHYSELESRIFGWPHAMRKIPYKLLILLGVCISKTVLKFAKRRCLNSVQSN